MQEGWFFYYKASIKILLFESVKTNDQECSKRFFKLFVIIFSGLIKECFLVDDFNSIIFSLTDKIYWILLFADYDSLGNFNILCSIIITKIHCFHNEA
jgi:hypothetical protein